MSVFKKLKGTFQNAQQDIVDGFRALTALDSQPRLEQVRSLQARDINLDAGADLLYHYQQQWSAIQTDTKESAKKAAEVSAMLSPLFKMWVKRSEAVAQLEAEVQAIPTIISTLAELHTKLKDLRQDFLVAEKGLEMLENICEEQELKRRFAEEQKKLAMYKAQKEAEVEKVKVELAQNHAKRMAELEFAKKVNLKERAEAFTSAFQEDLDYYKTHGHPSRMPTDFPKVSSLSQIELEQDKQALDSFLGDSGEADPEPGSLEVSGEAYFEDDYLPHVSPTRERDEPQFVQRKDLDTEDSVKEEEDSDYIVTKDLDTVDMRDYNISSCSLDELEDDDDDGYAKDDETRAKMTSELVQQLEAIVQNDAKEKGKKEAVLQGEGEAADSKRKSDDAITADGQADNMGVSNSNDPSNENQPSKSSPTGERSANESNDNTSENSGQDQAAS